MLPRRRLPTSCLPALLLVLACAPTAAGEPPRYAFDPVHTRVMFAIDHAGFSKAIGTISG
ncbi:MAG TPA: polyisoprenoid-binding protein, partial [Thermomonas sp.]|nr:polyisoprenoid-binding protein [Thermomonas sp.]